MQCVPIDGDLDSLIHVAVILHDGQAPDGCTAACKAAMEHLTDVRRRGWQMVQFARQQLTLTRIDPRRNSTRNPRMGLKVVGKLESIVKQSGRIAAEVKRCFEDLVAPIWNEEYLATRVIPTSSRF